MVFSQSVFCGSVKPWLVAVLVNFVGAVVMSAQDAQREPIVRGELVATMLTEHNAERITLGLTALSWDKMLAKDAARRATKLAAEGRFDHGHDELRRKKQGENLWMGTANSYAYPEMVSYWLDERNLAKSGVFPDISRTGNWIDVGHYSQIIWPATKKVGCAIVRNGDDEILVCRYFPAGNRVGDRLQVTPRK